jgi:outer membrane lipoprotein-sorting protein
MRFALLAVVFLALMPQAAFAADNKAVPAQQQPAVSQIPQEQQQAVNDVQEYLGGITTLKARFIQTDNEGKQLAGTFYLSRPGRMRIDYDPPSTDFIVADGVLIYYYDGKMKQQSSTTISRSLADFFLRKNLTLAGDISVSDIKRENNMLQMTLVQSRSPLSGSLTLMLSEKPLQLLAWKIVDEQGLVTEVRLTDTNMGLPLESSLFHYYDPTRKTHLYNNK